MNFFQVLFYTHIKKKKLLDFSGRKSIINIQFEKKRYFIILVYSVFSSENAFLLGYLLICGLVLKKKRHGFLDEKRSLKKMYNATVNLILN